MLDYSALEALGAIIRTGSFDRAAASLGVTASAISQRIRGLEERHGARLVLRGTPCTATAEGARLIRHLEEVRMLEQALAPNVTAPPTLRIVVNADSLETWFIHALGAVRDMLIHVEVDDESVSAQHLRDGAVSAALSADGTPVPGCDCIPLGALRYLATASPAFLERWCPDAPPYAEAMALAPCLTFNAKDTLQHTWLQHQGIKRPAPPLHHLPSTRGFVAATEAGLGWALNPDVLCRQLIAEGRLVPLGPNPVEDVALFWHIPRRLKGPLAPVTEAVRKTATQWLKSR
ncbi:MAG: LysR family transcriptional regulator ArgP [Pseudomonadota bacterium]